ncbi:LysE family translocator [Neisseriaceae bacterium TC5R-5]|nr:LysE family translocator [Neisseriaceae bacterium TC5R-5]
MPEFALLSYVVVMTITPGPNNLMLTASGVNFGFRRTIPHLLGISLGVAVLVFCVANLLTLILGGLHSIRLPLALLGCGYLLYLSWKTIRAGRPGQREVNQPLSLIGAALFQWVNPKAWVMALNAGILFMPANTGQSWLAAVVIALTFLVLGLPCICVWAWTGERLRRWLGSERALLCFNLLMGGLMALTALWLLWDELAIYFIAKHV